MAFLLAKDLKQPFTFEYLPSTYYLFTNTLQCLIIMTEGGNNMEIKIKENCEKEIVTFEVKKVTPKINMIVGLLTKEESDIIGYYEGDIHIIKKEEITCFVSEDNKVYAMYSNHKFQVKSRMYQLEDLLGSEFLRISNQSLINPKKIKKLSMEPNGTMKIVFKDGIIEYASRRCVKLIKDYFNI